MISGLLFKNEYWSVMPKWIRFYIRKKNSSLHLTRRHRSNRETSDPIGVGEVPANLVQLMHWLLPIVNYNAFIPRRDSAKAEHIWGPIDFSYVLSPEGTLQSRLAETEGGPIVLLMFYFWVRKHILDFQFRAGFSPFWVFENVLFIVFTYVLLS